jgi:hypothetical protein
MFRSIAVKSCIALAVLGAAACDQRQAPSGDSISTAAPGAEAPIPTAPAQPETRAASNGPFGVQMGMSVKKLVNCSKVPGRSFYDCATLPKTHSAFGSYIVKAIEPVGVCWVKAIGNEIENDAYGTKLRDSVDQLADQLGLTYGSEKKEKWDRLLTGSRWKDSDDWMMGLYKEERMYAFFWQFERPEKNDVKELAVFAVGTGPGSGRADVEFTFANKTQCEDAIKSQEAQAF